MKLIHHLGVCILMCGALTTNAQVSLTTYYIVPPTSGCNGLWAYGPASDLFGSGQCTGPYTYNTDPFGCAESSSSGSFPPFWISGDTVYSNLCSLPCTFELISAESPEPCVYCQVTLFMGTGTIEEHTVPVITSNPINSWDPYLRVELGAGAHTLHVLDALGRLVLTHSVNGGPVVLDLSGLGAGSYSLRALHEDGSVIQQRFMIG